MLNCNSITNMGIFLNKSFHQVYFSLFIIKDEKTHITSKLFGLQGIVFHSIMQLLYHSLFYFLAELKYI